MLMIWERLFRKVCFVSFLFLLISCNNIDIIKLKRAVIHNYGRIIDFSWQKDQLLPDTILHDCTIMKRPLTIVSKVSNSLCPECLGNYLRAAEFYISSFHTDSILFVVIVSSDKIKEIQALMFDISPQKVQVIHDVNDIFLKGQSIKEIKGMWNVFLLDRNHKITLMGDPLTQKKVKPLYNKQILEIINKEGWVKDQKGK